MPPAVAAGDLPMGIRKGVIYHPKKDKLKPGDGLFLYTDGVTDALNGSQERYGESV